MAASGFSALGLVMPCYHPLTGYRSKYVNANGKRSIVFDRKLGFEDRPVVLPCGQCVGCRLERSRQWAMRCVHEASLYEDNCFVTLTYADEHLPAGNTLRVRDFQLFMKRLRKEYGRGIRFFHCGEYGERRGRPHYHSIIFNHDFEDKQLWKVVNEQRLYVSSSLSRLWPLGFCSVGTVTFESAAYVARYCMKKVNGAAAEEYYRVVAPDTGEVFDRAPEYVTMSRMPSIGEAWFQRYKSDVYPSDEVVLRGLSMRPPKAYDRSLSERPEFGPPVAGGVHDEELLRRAKARRRAAGQEHADNNTKERLHVREQVQNARLRMLPRKVE